MNKDDELRFFWMGKTKRVRGCVEEYLEGLRGGKRVAQRIVCKKYGVNENTMRSRLKELRKCGLIDFYLKKGGRVYYGYNVGRGSYT